MRSLLPNESIGSQDSHSRHVHTCRHIYSSNARVSTVRCTNDIVDVSTYLLHACVHKARRNERAESEIAETFAPTFAYAGASCKSREKV